jgi:hypothetical protein
LILWAGYWFTGMNMKRCSHYTLSEYKLSVPLSQTFLYDLSAGNLMGDVHDQPSPKTAWLNLCEWSHNFWSENVTGCRGAQQDLGLQSMKHLLQIQHAFPGFNSLLCLNISRDFYAIHVGQLFKLYSREVDVRRPFDFLMPNLTH